MSSDTNADDGSASEGITFDPTVTGPFDVLRAARRYVAERARWFGGGILLLWLTVTIAMTVYEWEPPEIPIAFWVLVLASGGGALIGVYPIKRMIAFLWEDDRTILVDLDPVDGDLAIWELTEQKWAELTVVDPEGRVRSPSFLHETRLKSGRKAREVMSYDPESNIAVASWMAGAGNRDIRRHERAVEYIIRELSVEADKALDQLIEAPEAIREQGKVVGMHMIKTAEGVTTPDAEDSSVYRDLFDVARDANVSESLLEDRGEENIDEAISKYAEQAEGDGDGGGDSENGGRDVEEVVERIKAADRRKNGSGGGRS